MERSQPWIERLILGIMVLNGLWILSIPSFPTLDGWTHLHTARMLSDGQYGQFYCANSGLVPNQLAHWVLALLLKFLSPLLAERVLLAVIVTTMGLGSFALTRAFSRPNLLVLLVLPFTYGFLLVMGFHNFLLGVGLALLFAAWWIRYSAKRKVHYALVLLFSVVLYSTHTMALILFLAICGLHELMLVAGLHTRPEGWATGRIKPLFAFGLAVLPAVALYLHFDLAQTKNWGWIDRGQLLRELIDLRYLILYTGDVEVKFAYAMKLILVGSIVITMVHRLGPTPETRWKPRHSDLLLILAGLFLLLYFTLPDSAGYAGYISIRLQLFALLCIILWTAAQPIPWVVAFAPALMLIMLHQARLKHINKFTVPLAQARDLVMDAAQHIPEGAMVFPIHNMPNWELAHIPSLLAVDRKVDLLYSYEAGTGYFPLNWCVGLPSPLLGHLKGGDRCLAWLDAHVADGKWPVIDHIVFIGKVYENEPCYRAALETTLSKHFVPGYSNDLVNIYQLKVR